MDGQMMIEPLNYKLQVEPGNTTSTSIANRIMVLPSTEPTSRLREI